MLLSFREGNADAMQSQVRFINISLSLGLGLLILVSIISFLSVNRLAENSRWVDHTHQVLIALESVLSTLKDAETGQRGYLITGAERYLEPYTAAVSSLAQQLADLRTLTADNPQQQQRLDSLNPLITSKLTELQQTIDLRRTQGFDAAVQIVLTDRGKQIMDNIRQEILAMQQTENNLLVSRADASQISGMTANALTLIGAALSVLSLFGAFTLLRRSRQLLERQVQERTAQLSQANTTLYEQQQWLSITLSSIGDGLIATDAAGRISMINPAAEALTAWRQAEAVGSDIKRVFNIVNEYTRQSVDNPIFTVLRDGVTVGLANHTLLIAKDGTERAIDDCGAPIRDKNGKLIGTVLVFRDVSDQKSLERQIAAQQQSELQRQTSLSAVAFAVNSPAELPDVLDVAAGQLCQALAGSTASIFLLRPDKHFIECVAAVRFAVNTVKGLILDLETLPHAEQALESQGAVYFTIDMAGDGERSYFESLGFVAALVTPLIVESQVIGVAYVNFEQTREPLTDEDLRFVHDLANQCALAINKAHLLAEHQRLLKEARTAVELRDTFLSVAAHELKTPITSMRGFAQTLLRRLDRQGNIDGDQARLALQTIDQQSVKLNMLIGRLLDISRIEADKLVLERQSTDLSSLVRGLVAGIQNTTPQHPINVSAPDQLFAFIDGLRIEQILTNLLDNAIRYSPDGGSIEVALTALPPDKPETFTLSVTDHGIGIPPERRAQIFSRFYQAHGDGYGGGLGLGLYISQQFAQLHEGELSAEFPEEGGSRFIVKIPLPQQT